MGCYDAIPPRPLTDDEKLLAIVAMRLHGMTACDAANAVREGRLTDTGEFLLPTDREGLDTNET